jgi:hypothetical protein
MGFIDKRLDLTGEWYPTRVLRRFTHFYVLMSLGYVFIMVMIVRFDMYGLSSAEGPIVKAVYYWVLAMLTMLMFMNLMFILKIEGLRRDTKGMLIREYSQVTGKYMDELVGRILDEAGHPYKRRSPVRDLWWFFGTHGLYSSWYSIRNGALSIVVGQSMGTPRLHIIIGPMDELNNLWFDDIRRAIDDDLLIEKVPTLKGGPYQEYAIRSPLDR